MPARPRKHRLRITLRMMFLVVTLCCAALWWWQKPFDVESVFRLYLRSENGQPVFVEGRRVESVRRRWGDDHVKHGPTREYDHEGNLIFEEYWRQGIRHGLYRRWNMKSRELIAELEFSRGRLLRVGNIEVNDFMQELAADGAAGDRVEAELLRDARFDYRQNRLEDVVEDISFNHNLPFAIDTHALRKAGVQPGSLVTSDARGMPLFAALCVTLAPLELTCAYQYEAIWITTSESLLHEASMDLSSADPILLERLNQPALMDYLDQPLHAVLSDVSSRYKVPILTRKDIQTMDIVKCLRRLPNICFCPLISRL